MRPKLRGVKVEASGRSMEAAKRNAMLKVEKMLSQEGGWQLVSIESHEWPGYPYDRKTDSYTLTCWMIQYPKKFSK